MQVKTRLRTSITVSTTAAYCLIPISCALTPSDYELANDSAKFGPHSHPQNIYYCGSDTQNHYFARETETWRHPAASYFKIDRSLAIYAPEKPFSHQRAQWDHVTAAPRFLKEKPSVWPITRYSSSPTASSSSKAPN